MDLLGIATKSFSSLARLNERLANRGLKAKHRLPVQSDKIIERENLKLGKCASWEKFALSRNISCMSLHNYSMSRSRGKNNYWFFTIQQSSSIVYAHVPQLKLSGSSIDKQNRV